MKQKSLYELWLETTAETFGGYTQHDDYKIGVLVLLMVVVPLIAFLVVILH